MSKTLLSRINPRQISNSKPSKTTIQSSRITEICHILKTQNPNWQQTLETRLSEQNIVPSDIAHQVFDKIHDVHSALNFFQWITQRPYGCSLDGFAYSSLLKLLAKRKAFSEIDSVFIRSKDEKVSLLPNCDALSDVIRVCSECGLVDKAFGFYKHVKETYECFPNVFACNALLSGLVRDDRLESAFRVYDEMLVKMNADNYSTCIMVNAVCKKGKVEEGKKLIEYRWGKGCIPNVVFYNTLIDGYCKKGDVKKAFVLFKEVKLKGFLPGVETYGAMINGFCKEGNFGMVERLMNEMKSRGLLINVKVYNCVIDAQCRFGYKSKAVEILNKIIEEVGCVKPDIVTYNVLVNDSCKHLKVKEAEEFVEEAVRRGLKPNKLTYTPLINAYCRQNDTNKALDLFVKIIDNGEKPDLLAYTSLIHGIVVTGEVETATMILEKMSERGVFPDAGVYNVLINGLCKKGKLVVAKELLSKMLDRRVSPDKFVFATLIDGFVRNGEVEEAKKLFEYAIQSGIKLDVVGYNAMIKGYCKESKLNEAVLFVNTMFKARVTPDEFTYSTIIDGYIKQHDMDGALGIFSRMIKQNCEPNVVTYTSLINGFCQIGDIIRAQKLLKEMKSRRLMPNVVTYSILIGSCCKEGKLAKAASFFEEMLMSKCNPNDVTFHYLVQGFSKYDKYNEVKNSMFLDINSRMISDGLSPRLATYTSIVVCLSLHGMLDGSLKLCDKIAIRDCPVVFAALLCGICLKGKGKEWKDIVSCNLNESELVISVKYMSVFEHYCPNEVISDASSILQKLVSECKSRRQEVVSLEVLA